MVIKDLRTYAIIKFTKARERMFSFKTCMLNSSEEQNMENEYMEMLHTILIPILNFVCASYISRITFLPYCKKN